MLKNIFWNLLNNICYKLELKNLFLHEIFNNSLLSPPPSPTFGMREKNLPVYVEVRCEAAPEAVEFEAVKCSPVPDDVASPDNILLNSKF